MINYNKIAKKKKKKKETCNSPTPAWQKPKQIERGPGLNNSIILGTTRHTK